MQLHELGQIDVSMEASTRIKYKIFPSSQEGSSWPLPKNFISQDNHGLVSPDLELSISRIT